MEDLNKIVLSRGWKRIGNITDIKSAILKLLEQIGTEKSARAKLEALQRSIERLFKTSIPSSRKQLVEQLLEDSFFVLVFSKPQNKEYTRALRTERKSFLKLNATTQNVAMLDTLVDFFEDKKPKGSKDSSLIKALDHCLELRSALDLDIIDGESLVKAFRRSRKESTLIEGARYSFYDKMPPIKDSKKAARKLKLKPKRTSKK